MGPWAASKEGAKPIEGPKAESWAWGTALHTEGILSQSLLSRPHRACFPDLQHGYLVVWFVLDYTSDLLYLLDIVVHFHTGQ